MSFKVEAEYNIPDDEIKLRIKHEVIRQSKEIQQIRREVEAFENLKETPSARRERIAEKVRMFVWQRDQGRCVECGGKDRLEFDHIIPVVEGGASTERNIQLLCETCNRKKGRNI
jgi:5-methylcytosine-specific restriction endonuclease McrA